MRTAKVQKLDPLSRFLYWIEERHQVYLKRRAGLPKPWTDDEILQRFFFTNPYRENDKVTAWLRTHVRDPLRNEPTVIFATIAFRWFNYIPTGEILRTNYRHAHASLDCLRYSLLCGWDRADALRMLGNVRAKGGKIFTGAYMINSRAGGPKLEEICRLITAVWDDRRPLIRRSLSWKTMQAAHQDLMRYEGLGGFMAYEVVCDLRYTYVLERATDKSSWCNPGPGAVRGLYRLLERDFKKGKNNVAPPVPKDWEEKTVWLLETARRKLPRMPCFEMREIEHSLCEWDKYERALAGDGHMKRLFKGT